jgi:hypothetical protein
MNTPLASLSQIRSGTCGSVRYTQAEKAAHWEFVCNRNGITVRMLKRNNPAREACVLHWSTPASD